jgi:capsular polysaccharide biosynthesis protein
VLTASDALRALRDRWWVLVAAALLAAVAAYAYAKLVAEPRWRSSVLIQATGRLDYGNLLALEKELRPVAEQVRQLAVMREVDRNLHTDLPPELILEHTRAEPVQDSGQIRLDVEDSDADRAQQLALEIANVYTSQHNAAEQGKLREERVILSTLDRPTQAQLIWPLTRILLPGAALLGALVAAGIILAFAYFDDTFQTPAHVRHDLGLAVVGVIPRQRATAPAMQAVAPAPAEGKPPVDAPPVAAARR